MSDVIAELIKKEYGIDDIYVSGEDIVNEHRKIVSVSPKLNIILNGGIPEGTWATFTGPAKIGKTTLALHIAAKCQRPEYGSREVYYLDTERRCKEMNVGGVAALDMKKLHVIHSSRQLILSAQDFLKIGEYILRNVPNCLLIIDSYSALCHSSELAADVGTPVLGMGSYTLLAQFCRQMSQIVPVMNSNVIGITHLMANIGGFGNAAKTVEKGGNAIIYQGDIKLKAKFRTPWKVGERQIGQIVTWLCEFSALGCPGQEVESYIRYGKGIDELYELISCAMDFGLIEQTKSWYTLSFLPDKPKIQGGENIYKMLTDNPAAIKELEARLLGAMQ